MMESDAYIPYAKDIGVLRSLYKADLKAENDKQKR